MLVFASFPVVHPDSGRHIGKTARDISEIFSLFCSPAIFRKSHESVYLHPSRLRCSIEKNGLGGNFTPPPGGYTKVNRWACFLLWNKKKHLIKILTTNNNDIIWHEHLLSFDFDCCSLFSGCLHLLTDCNFLQHQLQHKIRCVIPANIGKLSSVTVFIW